MLVVHGGTKDIPLVMLAKRFKVKKLHVANEAWEESASTGLYILEWLTLIACFYV
jgi:hypothetical protein